jgi:transposase
LPEPGRASVAADGPAAQKKSLHAAERDTEANRKRREEFLATIAAVPIEKLKFLDESGVTTQMTRLWGRAPRGERVHEATPDGRWQVLTTLGAMSLRGMEAVMTVASATDGDVFHAYVEQVLCAQLQPGDVVVMDNLSAHKVAGIRQLIEARGAQLLYLPPYSPDLNPIEKAWSKFKQFLRSAKARTADALDNAITAALKTITTENAAAWFRSCGYVATRIQLL